jgi:DNA-binding transcriptional regulator YdaS (Cro superfamily)
MMMSSPRKTMPRRLCAIEKAETGRVKRKLSRKHTKNVSDAHPNDLKLSSQNSKIIQTY